VDLHLDAGRTLLELAAVLDQLPGSVSRSASGGTLAAWGGLAGQASALRCDVYSFLYTLALSR